MKAKSLGNKENRGKILICVLKNGQPFARLQVAETKERSLATEFSRFKVAEL